MKILVQWREENPRATEVVGPMMERIRYPLVPDFDERYQRHGITFECYALAMKITREPLQNGMITANQIMQWLWDNHRIHGERFVDGIDIGGYACALERRVLFLESAVERACKDLKKTRRWFGDKRFEKIRLELERIFKGEYE